MLDKKILDKVLKQFTEENYFVLDTGFDDLNYALKGIEKGSLITIGSRPAMGKTSFLLSILINLLKQNEKCLVFSYEMSTERIVKRLISMVSEISEKHLASFNLLHAKDMEKVADAIDKLSQYDVLISDEGFDINTIKEKIEAEKPDFVFIDNLQCMKTKSSKPRDEIISNIMLELKKLAKENDCLIFITSQLSRAVESRCSKVPMLSDLRESNSIEYCSDVVLFVYREAYYNLDIEENKDKAEIFIAKNKFGPTALIDLIFRGDVTKFLEPVRYDV